jgi:hypothetical protein
MHLTTHATSTTGFFLPLVLLLWRYNLLLQTTIATTATTTNSLCK